MSAGSPYSPHKILAHQDRLAAMKQGDQPVPIQIHLVISDTCNQNCQWCSYRVSGGPELFSAKQQMPFDKCREMLIDFANMGVRAVQFTGGGEPLMHHRHVELFGLAKEMGLDYALVTNGTLIADDTLNALFDASWVRVSLDAADAATYAKGRSVDRSAFYRATQNIAKLVKLESPLIGVGYVVNECNWRGVYAAAKLAKELGVDNIRISGAFLPSGIEYHRPFYEKAKAAACRAKEDFEGDGFKVFNLYGERLQDLEQGAPDYGYCGYMNIVTYVGADLNVYRCCNLAYTPEGLIGSLADQSFAELWQSQAKKDDFSAFDPRTRCKRCMFNNKNDVINYCLSDNKLHANFV